MFLHLLQQGFIYRKFCRIFIALHLFGIECFNQVEDIAFPKYRHNNYCSRNAILLHSKGELHVCRMLVNHHIKGN